MKWIDTNESDPYLLACAENMGFVERNLEVGDLASEDVVIERKTIKDFFNSLDDGRYLDQVQRMIDDERQAMVIVEGDFETSIKHIHREMSRDRNRRDREMDSIETRIKARMYDLSVVFGIPIFRTRDRESTVRHASYLISRGRKNRDRVFVVEPKKAPKTVPEMARYLMGLDGIGKKYALMIYNTFRPDTVRDLVEIPVAEYEDRDIPTRAINILRDTLGIM